MNWCRSDRELVCHSVDVHRGVGGGVLVHLLKGLYQLGGAGFLMQREAAIHPQVQLCIGKFKPTTKHLFSCLKCEEDEGVHSQFQALLAEVSEPGPGCCLTIANRLFGEITYPFFQVSDRGLPCNSSWEWGAQQNVFHQKAQRDICLFY